MRTFSPKQKVSIGVGIAVIAVGMLVFFASQRTNNRSSSPTPTPTATGNATVNEPKDYSDGVATPAASTPSPGSTPAPSTSNAPFAKPTLQMSSGNGGSVVPAGRAMEFTCETSPGFTCTLVLTDRKDPARVVNLGSRSIVSNGRGQYWASWQWSALAGSWSLVATASNGASTQPSDPVLLEVQ